MDEKPKDPPAVDDQESALIDASSLTLDEVANLPEGALRTALERFSAGSEDEPVLASFSASA